MSAPIKTASPFRLQVCGGLAAVMLSLPCAQAVSSGLCTAYVHADGSLQFSDQLAPQDCLITDADRLSTGAYVMSVHRPVAYSYDPSTEQSYPKPLPFTCSGDVTSSNEDEHAYVSLWLTSDPLPVYPSYLDSEPRPSGQIHLRMSDTVPGASTAPVDRDFTVICTTAQR